MEYVNSETCCELKMLFLFKNTLFVNMKQKNKKNPEKLVFQEVSLDEKEIQSERNMATEGSAKVYLKDINYRGH